MSVSPVFRLSLLAGFLAVPLGLLAQPRLTVTNDPGGILLAWPAAATNWLLERTASPHRPVQWTVVSRSEVTSGAGVASHRVPTPAGSAFFRLRQGGKSISPALEVQDLFAAWALDEGEGDVAFPLGDADALLWLHQVNWVPGRLGASALAFNGGPAAGTGSRARLDLAARRLLPAVGAPFSVSFWLNPDGLTNGWQGLVGTALTASNGWQLALHNSGPGTNLLVLAGAGPDGWWSTTGRTLLLPGQWRHVTITHDGTAGCLHLDSRPLACGTGRIRPAEGPLWFGGGVGDHPSFHGRLDALRLYTNALTAQRLALVGEWRFDEGAGDRAADSGLLGRTASGLGAAAWAPGRRGSGLDLGAGPVVIANADGDLLPLNSGPFSLSFWLRPHALPLGRGELMRCDDAQGGWQLAVETDAAAQTWLRWTATNGGTLDLPAPLPLPPGLWTKVDLTFSGASATVYANGTRVLAAQGAIRGRGAPLQLGAGGGEVSFNGVLDELQIYSHERAPAEIGPVAETQWETALLNSATNLVLAGSGPAGKPLTFTILTNPVPTRGTLSHVAGAGVVTYHAGAQKGPDAFAYTVSDGEFTSPPATVVVSVVHPHWLAPGGGTEFPLDGTSPARAWLAGSAAALDAIWRTNNYHDAFFYAPGVYETTGFKAGLRSSANPGCKHYGSGAEGPDATTLRLVNTWEAWSEGTIFAGVSGAQVNDGFEAHHLALDCNAVNNPKYVCGETVWLRFPLTRTARVDTVTLHWTARPAQFSVCARTPTNGGFTTNCFSLASSSYDDVVAVGAVADEIRIQLECRPTGQDFYGLKEIEANGGEFCRATATVPGGGNSLLDVEHSIAAAVDSSTATAWASGVEAQVQLTFPFAAGTAISQLTLNWNCQTLSSYGWLGPAAEFLVLARDDGSGQLNPVPVVRHGRAASGLETVTFGTTTQTNPVITSQLAILLTAREPGVVRYSLRDVAAYLGSARVAMRLPSGLNSLSTSTSPLRACDGNLDTVWVSGTQGMVGAVDIRGSNLKFTHLRVTGFGTKQQRECFPFYIYAPASLPVASNVLVSDCVFTDPAPWNPDGLTVVAVLGQGTGRLRNAVVRRCTVAGMRPHFANSKAFTAARVEDCVVNDCDIGVYFEPEKGIVESLGPVLVRSNQFLRVNSGVYLLMHAGTVFDSLTCLGNEVVFAGLGYRGWGFAACDTCATGPSGTITNFTVLNNCIRYADWVARPSGVDNGVHHSDIQHAVFGNNLLVMGHANALRVRPWPSGLIPAPRAAEDCDHPNTTPPGNPTYPPSLDVLPSGYRRAWFENRDLFGTLLPVRQYQSGSDRVAAQQQWP
jgi:hypothetical protein